MGNKGAFNELDIFDTDFLLLKNFNLTKMLKYENLW